jgi:hypothetical protein
VSVFNQQPDVKAPVIASKTHAISTENGDKVETMGRHVILHVVRVFRNGKDLHL